ncbi:hypothetical protein O6H91_23G071800 [Diphasiastrum complanatum]|uniref:Uncharacterized protein n=1 Tax=Diphasiastrum complanatum TaxID=34168 RepID=A0ACC2AC00_DIPCM|nr:hypothetical protein O6H91_23G071800 [Diphasiastrum complanatum]
MDACMSMLFSPFRSSSSPAAVRRFLCTITISGVQLPLHSISSPLLLFHKNTSRSSFSIDECTSIQRSYSATFDVKKTKLRCSIDNYIGGGGGGESSDNDFEKVVSMVDEECVGIQCYTNATPGFRGVLKQRYADFIVNEVDPDGNVVHLTNLAAPAEALISDAELETPNFFRPEDTESENIVGSDYAPVLEAFKTLAGDANADILKTLLEQLAGEETVNISPITLLPDSDKMHRTGVHNFFKSRLPHLITDTVDGPDNASKCIRVRFCTGKKNRGTRGRTDIKDNNFHNKRQKQDVKGGAELQPFDGRGADNWPTHRPKFLQFHLYKENKDTQDALMVIARMLGTQPKSFGFAGTKDKRAITTQRVTAFKQSALKLAALNKRLYGIRVGNFCYVDNGLVLGELSGNRFTVTLRGVVADSECVLSKAAEGLKKGGFVNYFGLQRFGTGSVPTHTIGATLLRGEWKAAVDKILLPREAEQTDAMEAREYYRNTGDVDGALLRMPRYLVAERSLVSLKRSPGNFLQAISNIPRTLRMMYVHSYQSYLWNHAATRRVQRYGVQAVVEGDLVLSDVLEDRLSHDEMHDCDDPLPENHVVSNVEDGSEIYQEAAEPEVDNDRKINVKRVSADDVKSGRYSIRDVLLPLPGSSTLYPGNETSTIYQDLAAKDFLNLKSCTHNVKEFSIVHLPGGYRHLIVCPQDYEWKVLKYDDVSKPLYETDLDKINKTCGEHGSHVKTENQELDKSTIEFLGGSQTALQLSFTLPSSCYATMAIRQLLKASTSATFHKTLNED